MSKIENELGIPEDDFHRAGLIDRLQQYLEADPGAWHMRYNLGLALLQEQRPDEALQQFQQVLKEAPKHLESLINIGGIHLSRGEPDLALKAFTNALSVWDVPVVRANLGVAYLQLGLITEAEREFRRALEANPQMAEAWCNLGSLLLQTDRLEESLEASRKAIELVPEFAMAHNNLAVALMELDQGDQAREHAARARELGYPVHDKLLERLGLLEQTT